MKKPWPPAFRQRRPARCDRQVKPPCRQRVPYRRDPRLREDRGVAVAADDDTSEDVHRVAVAPVEVAFPRLRGTRAEAASDVAAQGRAQPAARGVDAADVARRRSEGGEASGRGRPREPAEGAGQRAHGEQAERRHARIVVGGFRVRREPTTGGGQPEVRAGDRRAGAGAASRC